jgi:hypothetical protein
VSSPMALHEPMSLQPIAHGTTATRRERSINA